MSTLSVAAPAAQTTTDTLGYYNPNAYRLKLSSSALGLNMSLNPGAFVINQAGHKVNDPRLEAHVGSGRLARSKAPNGPVSIVPVGTAPDTRAAAGFTASNESRAPHQAPLPPVPQTDPTPVRPVSTNARVTSRAVIGPGAETTSSTASFRAMSMSKAMQLGLVKPSVVPPDADLPSATAGYTRGTTENAPHIDEVLARDASGPREAAALLASAGKAKQAPSTKASPTKMPAKAQSKLARVTAPVIVPEVGEGEHEDIGDDVDTVDFGAESARLLAEAGATVAAAAAPIAPAVTPFICAADREEFGSLDQLKKHIKRNFPDREEELLKGY